MGPDFDPYATEIGGSVCSQHNAAQGAQVIQIDSSKHVAAVAICAAICGLSLAVSMWASHTANQAAMEARVFQEKANQLRGELEGLKEIRNGH